MADDTSKGALRWRRPRKAEIERLKREAQEMRAEFEELKALALKEKE